MDLLLSSSYAGLTDGIQTAKGGWLNMVGVTQLQRRVASFSHWKTDERINGKWLTVND
jgi:hypothetical protein